RQQIFKLSSQDGCRANGNFIERSAGFALGGFDRRGVRYLYSFANGRDLESELERDCLADREVQILLNYLGETALGGRDRVSSRTQRKENKPAVWVSLLRSFSLCVQVFGGYIGVHDHGARLVEGSSLNNASCDLCLSERSAG